MRNLPPWVVRELKSLAALVVILVVFSVLYTLGFLALHQEWPRWK